MGYVLAVTMSIYLLISAGFLAERLDWTAAAEPPTALFVIGGSLVVLQLADIRGDIALIAFRKLLLRAAVLLAVTVTSFVSISLLIALLPPAWLPAH